MGTLRDLSHRILKYLVTYKLKLPLNWKKIMKL